jgi:hypothetical protein
MGPAERGRCCKSSSQLEIPGAQISRKLLLLPNASKGVAESLCQGVFGSNARLDLNVVEMVRTLGGLVHVGRIAQVFELL